jgi:predicted Zn-dependent peptidase
VTRATFDRASLSGVRVLGERRLGDALALAVVLDVGARDELPGEEGAAHFLEHVAFKGDAATSAEALAERIDALGGEVNAFTSHEQTCYHGVTVPERAGALIEVLATLLTPALRERDVAAERPVIEEEIAMALDDPTARAFEWAAERYYGAHPFARSVLGGAASVAGMTSEALRAFRARTHHPERVRVIAVGRYDFAALTAALAPALAALPRGAAPRRGRVSTAFASGSVATEMVGGARVHLGLHAPAPRWTSRERIAAELLASVLGAPDHGRLHWLLVDPGLAEAVGVHYDGAADHGLFTVHARVAPRAQGRVQRLLQAALFDFERDGPSEAEWSVAQRELALSVTLEGESVEGRALALATEAGRPRSLQREVEEILTTPRAAAEAILARRPFARALHFEVRPATVVRSRARWRP